MLPGRLLRITDGDTVRVQLDVTDQSDGYDRMVARILSEGEDLNAWMVRAGHAWVYRQYADPAQDAGLCRLEHEARRSSRGFWDLPANRRIAPWEWRRNQRGQARRFTDWSRETPDNCRGAPQRRRIESARRVRHQGQHQPQRPHLPPAEQPALRADHHRRVGGGTLVLQRTRGARGGLAAATMILGR